MIICYDSVYIQSKTCLSKAVLLNRKTTQTIYLYYNVYGAFSFLTSKLVCIVTFKDTYVYSFSMI